MKGAATLIPIIVLSTSVGVSDNVLLLDMGADDFVTMHFSPQELLARLRVALRHSKRPAGASQVVFDGVLVNFEEVEETRNGTSVVLTAHEFNTPQFMVQNPH